MSLVLDFVVVVVLFLFLSDLQGAGEDGFSGHSWVRGLPHPGSPTLVAAGTSVVLWQMIFPWTREGLGMVRERV